MELEEIKNELKETKKQLEQSRIKLGKEEQLNVELCIKNDDLQKQLECEQIALEIIYTDQSSTDAVKVQDAEYVYENDFESDDDGDSDDNNHDNNNNATVKNNHSTKQKLMPIQEAETQANKPSSAGRSRDLPDWILSNDEIALSDINIGKGAYANVVQGTFRGCKVAVKIIHDLILSEYNRQLFEREMNMASRCRHPCLLQFIGATADEHPLFVTELLDTSLRAVLETRQALDFAQVSAIALDVARGLNYLHLSRPHPIIHRDVSNGNVLLWRQNNSWRAKVSDYGTANFLHACKSLNGTPIYLAPEAHNPDNQTTKIDVYSYGVLLCEMNTGVQPDPSLREQQIELVTNQTHATFIRRCLHKDQNERPSMSETIDVLERASQ